MDCREHAAMAGIQSIEEGARFGTAHFTNDDPVRAVPENGFQELIKSDCALVRIELSFGGDDVRFSDSEFCRVFNDQNAIFIGDRIGEDVDQCGFPCAGSSGYQDIVATM